MNKPLQGSGYDLNSTSKGFSLDIHKDYIQEYSDNFAIKVKPFDCVVEKGIVGASNVYRLKVAKGEVGYNYAVTDLGFVGSGSLQPLFLNIDKFNLFPTGTRTNGSTASSVFLNSNGYITLTSGNDYVVFIYILGPQYEPDNTDPFEFSAPQLAVSKIGDDPEKIINGPNNLNYTADIQIWSTYFAGDPPTIVTAAKYRNTFSLRCNIARIKWNAGSSTFDIEQLTNTPKLDLVPNICTGNDEPTFDDTTVNAIINGFTGYTKDLNESVYGFDASAQGEL